MSIATDSSTIRLGVIASSGGSVFESLYEISSQNRFVWAVVTDRPCGIEELAIHRDVFCGRITETSNREFSMRAAEVLSREKVEVVFLFFLRLVTAEIYDRFLCVNFHPSLLPEFSGFNAIRRAHASGTKSLGATVHFVTSDPDGGPIIAQTSDPVENSWSIECWQNLSYVQKVRLGTWLLDEMLVGERFKAFAGTPTSVLNQNWRPRDKRLASGFSAWLSKSVSDR